jgi:hypothetical protein
MARDLLFCSFTPLSFVDYYNGESEETSQRDGVGVMKDKGLKL